MKSASSRLIAKTDFQARTCFDAHALGQWVRVGDIPFGVRSLRLTSSPKRRKDVQDNLCQYCLGLGLLSRYDAETGNVVDERCNFCERENFKGSGKVTAEELIKKRFGEDSIK